MRLELLIKVPSASKLVDIKGMGMVAAAVIVSEIGDISRFNDPKQIQKMAGLSLRENSSGKHKGKTRISKRGRRSLREGLFRAMITMLATNSEFRQLHQRNLSREQNPCYLELMWNPDGRDRKTHAVYFLCLKPQSYQIYTTSRGKA